MKNIISILIGILISCSVFGGDIKDHSYEARTVGGFDMLYQSDAGVYWRLGNPLWFGWYIEEERHFFMFGEIVNHDKVWALISAKKGESIRVSGERKNIKSIMTLHQVDCEDKMVRIVRAYTYDNYWGHGNIIDEGSGESEWDYAVPGSLGNRVLTYTCHRIKNGE